MPEMEDFGALNPNPSPRFVRNSLALLVLASAERAERSER